MAGHSQFKNIMHKKGRADKARSKLFSNLAREITVAAKLGMPDAAFNPPLRAAILAARAENMPKDNIERAIKKSQGSESENYDQIRYEGYAPGGIAVIVEALTDNRNRTAGEVRSIFTKAGGNLAETGAGSFMFDHVRAGGIAVIVEALTDNRNRTAGEVRSIFTKAGGNLAETGAVSFMFDHVGVVEYEANKADADTVLEAAIEAGADDVISNADGHQIFTATDSLAEVSKALEAKFGEPRKSAVVWEPQKTMAVDDEAGEKILQLMDALDDSEDVQNVYAT